MTVRRYAYGPAIKVEQNTQYVTIPSSDPNWSDYTLEVFRVAAPGCEGDPVAVVSSSGYAAGSLSFPASAIFALGPGEYVGHIVHATIGVVHRTSIIVPEPSFGASGVTVI